MPKLRPALSGLTLCAALMALGDTIEARAAGPPGRARISSSAPADGSYMLPSPSAVNSFDYGYPAGYAGAAALYGGQPSVIPVAGDEAVEAAPSGGAVTSSGPVYSSGPAYGGPVYGSDCNTCGPAPCPPEHGCCLTRLFSRLFHWPHCHGCGSYGCGYSECGPSHCGPYGHGGAGCGPAGCGPYGY